MRWPPSVVAKRFMVTAVTPYYEVVAAVAPFWTGRRLVRSSSRTRSTVSEYARTATKLRDPIVDESMPDPRMSSRGLSGHREDSAGEIAAELVLVQYCADVRGDRKCSSGVQRRWLAPV